MRDSHGGTGVDRRSSADTTVGKADPRIRADRSSAAYRRPSLRERLYYRRRGYWPESVVERRLAALGLDEAEIGRSMVYARQAVERIERGS